MIINLSRSDDIKLYRKGADRTQKSWWYKTGKLSRTVKGRQETISKLNRSKDSNVYECFSYLGCIKLNSLKPPPSCYCFSHICNSDFLQN